MLEKNGLFSSKKTTVKTDKTYENEQEPKQQKTPKSLEADTVIYLQLLSVLVH